MTTPAQTGWRDSRFEVGIGALGIARRQDALLDWLRKPLCVFCLAFADVLTIVIALQGAVLIRSALLPTFLQEYLPGNPFLFGHYVSHWWLWPLYPMVFAFQGLYSKRSTLWTETLDIVRAVSLGTLCILAAVTLGAYGADVSRLTLLLTGFLLLFLMPLGRILCKQTLLRFDLWRKRALVLGAARTGRLAMTALTDDPVLGYSVVGFLDDDPQKWGKRIGSANSSEAKVLGPLAMAQSLLAQGVARDVVIAMPGLSEKRLVELVYALQGSCETIRVVPRFWGLPMMSLHLDFLLDARFFTLNITNNLAKAWNRWLKRGFDVFCGGLLAMAALPILLFLATLVILDSKGWPFFSQLRMGRGGGRFRCFKLRSMRINADQHLAAFLERNPELREEWEKYAKIRAGDPRLTRVGRFLRRWSLDELPQLVNVLRGEMSLVGPRPYLPRELERIGPDLEIILRVRPGITGLWQVSGRNDLTFEERVSLESWYIRNWSLWLDLIILAKTTKAVLCRRGSHA